jgi:D-sedoheptulose 7-phosphate isomerase
MSFETVNEYINQLSALLLATEVTDGNNNSMSLEEGADRAVEMILDVKASLNKVILTGNGGSAAVVSHVQNDLCKAVQVPALVFTEQPLLTALANDEGYGSIFETPIELWAQAGDLLVSVSSSGNSENIVRGLKAAKGKGCRIITMSGFSPDNSSRAFGDLNFYVRSDEYGCVETAHACLTHFMTDRARDLSRTAKV